MSFWRAQAFSSYMRFFMMIRIHPVVAKFEIMFHW